MTDFEKMNLDSALREFAHRNFMKPDECRNLDQVRYYANELCQKIEEYYAQFQYVPGWAIVLLSQYKHMQIHLVHKNLRPMYA